MASRFAASTEVEERETIAEIRVLVKKYGGTDFAETIGDSIGAVTWKMKDRRVAVKFAMPDPEAPEFTHAPGSPGSRLGRPRAPDVVVKMVYQARRATWRAVLFYLKAKFVAVDAGITTIEDQFMAETIMPGTSVTVADCFRQPLRDAIANRSSELLLPPPPAAR